MARFAKKDSLSDFQKFIFEVYGLPDDRLFSIFDLLSNLEKFTMRALKGIRKKDYEKIRINLLISISWLAAIANRLHINLTEGVEKRFPGVCSYCKKSTCECKSKKIIKRIMEKPGSFRAPRTLEGIQKLFLGIYPPEKRTMEHSGIHLAEELGELSEAVHRWFAEHRSELFASLENEAADYLSCIFGVANSSGFDLAEELSKIFKKNCHVCHLAPCKCAFSKMSSFSS